MLNKKRSKNLRLNSCKSKKLVFKVVKILNPN